MIPGIVSKLSRSAVASAATIDAKSDIILISGSTQINTINPYNEGVAGQMAVLIPTDGTLVLGTSGNILVGITMAQNRATPLFYDKVTAKWYIDNGV